MPQNTTEFLPVRVRRLRAAKRDAEARCAEVCGNPDSTPDERKAALAARAQAAENYEIWDDVLREQN